MALKESNKNRKKAEQTFKAKVKEVNTEHEAFQKDFIKYYCFVFGVIIILFFIL